MKHELDKQMMGHAVVFDGPLDLISNARRAQEPLNDQWDENYAAYQEAVKRYDKDKVSHHKAMTGHWADENKHLGETRRWEMDEFVGPPAPKPDPFEDEPPKYPDYPRRPKAMIAPHSSYTGREAKTWKELEAFLGKPWPSAVKLVTQMCEEIRRHELPVPKDARRRPRWDENDGEVDVDRVRHGDPDYYRRMKRELVVGPTSVTLLCNLETVGTPPKEVGVYWRSIAAIAVTDVLEELGYAVELWMWCRGHHVYKRPYHNQFNCMRIKEAGTPLDLHATCDALSAWFTYNGIFGTFACVPEAESIGGGDTSGPGGWGKYMMTEGSRVIDVPVVFSKGDSLKAAVSILEKCGGDS